MNRLRFLRIAYLLPVLALGLWPVPINCQQCGERVAVESFFSRVASDFEDNFFCGIPCALDWMAEHPILRDEDGNIIRRY